jgi:hypothetical protein
MKIRGFTEKGVINGILPEVQNREDLGQSQNNRLGLLK